MKGGPIASFVQCENANISICNATSAFPYIIVAYNPLPRAVVDVLRVPAPVDVGSIVVQDANGKFVPYDTIPTPDYDQREC